MLRLSASTCIDVEEPSDDGGFITWFDVLIHRYPPADDDGAGGGDLDEGDEKVEQIGRARIAIVHVGDVANRGDSLYDALDADSGDLEALYHLYFDEESGWFKDEFGGGAGVDLGYIQALMIKPTWKGRNIELAVVQRLNTTIAAGCKMLVISVSSPEEIARWKPMGFEVSAPERREPGHVHLNNEMKHPRVVALEHPRGFPEPHEEDRFKVLVGNEDDEPEEVEPAGSSATAPPPASPARTRDAVARRAIASRRPSRRRQ